MTVQGRRHSRDERRRMSEAARVKEYGNAATAELLTGMDYQRLSAEARQRGVTPDRLAAQLLAVVVADGLIGAVLGEK